MPFLNVKKVAQLTGHNAAIFALAPSTDARHFLSGAGDGWVVQWNLDAPELGRLVAKVETQIFSLLNLPDLHTIVVGNMNGGVHWINLEQPEKVRNITHHDKGVFGILRIGAHVFTIGGDGKITCWSAVEARSLESFYLSNQSLRSLDFCPARQEIAVGASDNSIYLLDSSTLNLKNKIESAHANSVFALKYSLEGRYLLSGGRDAYLKIWDTQQDFQLVFDQPAHWFTINHIVFDPVGRWFVTASRDKTIKIWDAYNFTLLKVLEVVRDRGHVNSVNRLLWVDDRCFISAGDDRTMILWEVQD